MKTSTASCSLMWSTCVLILISTSGITAWMTEWKRSESKHSLMRIVAKYPVSTYQICCKPIGQFTPMFTASASLTQIWILEASLLAVTRGNLYPNGILLLQIIILHLKKQKPKTKLKQNKKWNKQTNKPNQQNPNKTTWKKGEEGCHGGNALFLLFQKTKQNKKESRNVIETLLKYLTLGEW